MMGGGQNAVSAREMGLLACIALVSIGPLSSLAQAGLSPVMPALTTHFSAEPDAAVLVRMMVTGLSAAMIVGSLCAAFLVERVGPKRLLLMALAVYALAGGIGAILDNLRYLVASRLFLGVVTACIGVVAATLITTRLPLAMRDRWLGYYTVVATFGGLIATLMAGVVGASDWRNVFWLHLIAMPVFLALWRLLPGDAAPSGHGAIAGKASAGSGRFPWQFLLFGMVNGLVVGSAMAFMPFHLADVGLGATISVTAIMAAAALMSGVSSLAFGWIRARFSIVQAFAIGYTLIAFGILIVLMTNQFPLVVTGMAFYGLGIGVAAPNLFAASAAGAAPEKRARTIGLVRAGFYSGPLVSQVPFEPLVRAYGPWTALLGIAVCAALSLAVAIAIRREFIPFENRVAA